LYGSAPQSAGFQPSTFFSLQIHHDAISNDY
jgi:hypothetical protein